MYYGVDKYDIGTGFGHFAIATPDVYKLVEDIKAKGGIITREPGPVKGGKTVIAFAKDPDGYLFELIQRGPTPEPLCQVMLRVGDLDRSIKFYEKGTHSSETISQLSTGSPSTFNQSPSSFTAQHPGSTAVITELYEPYQSPGSVEVSSDAVIKNNGMDHIDGIKRMGEISGSSEPEVTQTLQRLKEQLSLDDGNLEEILPFRTEIENSNDSEYIINGQCRPAASPDDLENLVLQRESGGNGKHNHKALAQEFTVEREDSLYWKEMLESYQSSPRAEFQEKNLRTLDGNTTSRHLADRKVGRFEKNITREEL
ncbi:Lactoylglutathione lyase [Camellia lanceoleosa]|uniref:Lactoylglutathione lyase n=1 Tax=Camellia lanceoleosa TaxID=1840588 RepID=A0ACC0I221_9ERIC|nr:Lactoylglutathione lyase [Camellia lanceoleosa]